MLGLDFSHIVVVLLYGLLTELSVCVRITVDEELGPECDDGEQDGPDRGRQAGRGSGGQGPRLQARVRSVEEKTVPCLFVCVRRACCGCLSDEHERHIAGIH